MAEERFPVFSPALAAGPPPLGSPAGLQGVSCSTTAPTRAAAWLAEAGVEGGRADRGPVSDARNEALAAAANGIGVALAAFRRWRRGQLEAAPPPP